MRLFSFLLLLGTFFMGITTGLIDISNAMSEPVQGENKNISQESPLQPIAGKNIFSPERKDFPLLTLPSDAKTLQKPKVRPQITLYGTTLAGDYQSASITQSGRPLKKGERELMTVKIGDQIAEYRVTKIFPDKILLESESDQFEVLLDDPKMPKRRVEVRTETKPATVTTTLVSSAAPVEVKREAEAPKESVAPPTTPAPPTLPPRGPARREGLQDPRNLGRERGIPMESPSTVAPPPTPSTPPGGLPQVTPLPAPMRPTPIPIPPGMGTPLPPPSQ